MDALVLQMPVSYNAISLDTLLNGQSRNLKQNFRRLASRPLRAVELLYTLWLKLAPCDLIVWLPVIGCLQHCLKIVM